MTDFPRDELSREAALEKRIAEWEAKLDILVHENLNGKTLDWFAVLVYHNRLLSGILHIQEEMRNVTN